MNHLAIDARQFSVKTAIDHAPGTLLLCSTETDSHPGPFWALRFDGVDSTGTVAHDIIWLTGMPWHGDPAFFGENLDRHRWGQTQVIGCGKANLEIDPNSGVGGGRRSDLNWDRAGGHIATTSRGSFLIGRKSDRITAWGGYWAVNLSDWTDVPDAQNEIYQSSELPPVSWTPS